MLPVEFRGTRGGCCPFAEESVDILTAGTEKDWVSTVPHTKSDEKALQGTESVNQRLNQLLTEILLSENLVVLP
jgi:hypothetical protein